MNYLNIYDILYIHDILIVEKYNYDEPIEPAYEYQENDLIDCIHKIDVSINNPKQTFDGVELYPTLEEKAGVLFLSIIKNHPFINGNKRTSVFSLFLFMAMNNCWLKFKHYELYKLAESLSSRSTAEIGFDKEKAEVIEYIQKGKIEFKESMAPGIIKKIFKRLLDFNK